MGKRAAFNAAFEFRGACARAERTRICTHLASGTRSVLPTYLFPALKAALLRSKPHYPVLDGLRGVAAVTVVAFHLFEANATSHLDQIINHGYLAVDFFFLLSGFVIGYAYDDRWQTMTIGDFFKRRLVRLQPMVVLGMLIGAVGFYFQDSVLWPHIHEVPVWKMLLYYAGRVYPAARPPVDGHPGVAGNASAERAGLVVVF